jgi:hypothetical protein
MTTPYVCPSCNGTKKIKLLFSDIDCADCVTPVSDIASKKDYVWALDEALDLIRELEKQIKPIKYTSAMGGGVIFKGHSKKDLDIFLAPYNKTDKDYDKLVEILEKMGFTRKKTKDEVHKGFNYGSEKGKEHKHVEIWDYHGRRVDFFFVD